MTCHGVFFKEFLKEKGINRSKIVKLSGVSDRLLDSFMNDRGVSKKNELAILKAITTAIIDHHAQSHSDENSLEQKIQKDLMMLSTDLRWTAHGIITELVALQGKLR